MNNNEHIIQVLKMLVEEINSAVSILDTVNVSSLHYQKEYGTYRDGLKSKADELNVYCSIENAKLCSLNIYSLIKSEFKSRNLKNTQERKKTVFYINTGNGKEECYDENVLNTYFTIDNCLPILKSIFTNICDNAIKYMPNDSELSVECSVVGATKEFKFRNLGPHLERTEFDSILKPGYRGYNASRLDISGQGLGLSQIRPILELHKGWIDTKFTIRPSVSSPILINSVPYSPFILVLSFDPRKDEATRSSVSSTALSSIPEVVLHNVLQIVSSVIETYNNIIPSLDSNHKESLKYSLFNINKLKCSLLLILYVYSEVNSIFGNETLIRIQHVIYTIARMVNLDYHFDKVIVEGECQHSIRAYTSFYSIFWKLLQILCENTMQTSQVNIDFDDQKICFSVESPDKFDIESLLDVSWDDRSDYNKFALEFCLDYLDFSQQNHDIDCNRNKYTISFPL